MSLKAHPLLRRMKRPKFSALSSVPSLSLGSPSNQGSPAAGMGASFGTGKQWQSWIHIQDLASMFLYVLEKKLSGVYNGVAPNPVTNNELTRTIAAVLKRPLFMPNIPKFFMKFILGEMHTLLYESQRVSSKKIENKGLYFKFHHLKPALEDLLT